MSALQSKNRESSSETYETLMRVAWNCDYQGKITKLDDLYNRAKENQWNTSELDWDLQIDPSNPIAASSHTPYAEMSFFKHLSQRQRESFTAHSMAQC